MLRRWPLLLVAAILLLAGGWRVVETGDFDTLASALIAAGLILLGVWVRDEVDKDG